MPVLSQFDAAFLFSGQQADWQANQTAARPANFSLNFVFSSSENQVRQLRSESGLLSVPYHTNLECAKEKTEQLIEEVLSILKACKIIANDYLCIYLFLIQEYN